MAVIPDADVATNTRGSRDADVAINKRVVVLSWQQMRGRNADVAINGGGVSAGVAIHRGPSW